MKRTKKFLAFLVAFAIMMSSSFTLISNVVYADSTKIVEFRGDSTLSKDGTSVTYEVGGKDVVLQVGSRSIDYEKGEYVFNADTIVDNGGHNEVSIDTYSGRFIRVDNSENANVAIWINGNQAGFEEGNNEWVSLAGYHESERLVVEAVENDNYNNGSEGGSEDISFDIKFTNTHINVWINNKTVLSDENGDLLNSYEGTIEEAGTTASNETNTLRFIECFGDAPVNEYVINGVSYKEGTEGVEVVDGEFRITVPGAEKYVIRGEGDTSVQVPRTIIWTNPGYVPKDEEDAEWIKEFSLKNGSAYIKAVYDEDGNLVDNDFGTGVGEDYFGWVDITPGYKVVFEFVPEYGYQLTEVLSNGHALEPQSVTNQYIFTMPDTNIHFDAEFTKTEDIVKANSIKVSSGEVTLGKNALGGGTAQLTVNDIELTSEKIAGFEKAAGEYSISDYLDIDLYQVFYKGKNDANDVWSNKISELDKEATISIKLEDGVNTDDIIIVHNIHDGEEYEIIEVDSYDAETNTITFKTKSFSNYAIATKTATSDTKSEVSNPAEEEASKLLEAYMKDGIVKGASKELFDIIIAAATAGKDIAVEVSAPEVKAEDLPTEDVKKVAEKMPEGSKVAAYFDIDLLVKIEREVAGEITELNSAIKVTVPMPTDLPEVKEGYTREYYIIRVHDGVAEELDAVVSGENISFKTNLFSTYALAYRDVANTASVKTGDNIVIFAGVFAIAGAGMFITLKLNKQRVTRKH